jgi:hypothetical protein
VTRVVKSLGSGKLGRISTCEDGSVVFDLGAKKAELLMGNVVVVANNDSKLVDGWHFEMPVSLPAMTRTHECHY